MDHFTSTEALIMQLLIASASKPLYGNGLVDQSNGQIPRGSIYLNLKRLEDRGYLKSEKEKDPEFTIPKRLYQVTGLGQRAFQAWQYGQDAQRQYLASWSSTGALNNV
jgi:DNA-binding PadR family transcriptional regulator